MKLFKKIKIIYNINDILNKYLIIRFYFALSNKIITIFVINLYHEKEII